MSRDNPTARPPAGKPTKPYPEFPLFPHATKRWAKKIRGAMHYFGPWDDPDGALKKYLAEKDDLHAGRTPRVNPDGLVVKELANRFLTAKKNQLDAGELSLVAFAEYRAATDLVVAQFGLTRLVDDLAAPDFEALRASMAKRLGPVRLGNEIQRVRTVFKYAYESGLIDRPMRFGPGFAKPSKTVMRKHKAKAEVKLFTPDELKKLIDGAGVQMRAMILLGVNCGFGNTDCSSLPLSAVDLASGWIDFPRPKTGIGRRCPLWPETADALRAVVEARGKPKGFEACGLVFVNERGSPWVHFGTKQRTDNVTVQFTRLTQRLKIHRSGVGFYALRHVFRTAADEVRDPVAIDLIMGHGDESMGARYREKVSDDRLKAVTDHVRAWLWPKADEPASTAT